MKQCIATILISLCFLLAGTGQTSVNFKVGMESWVLKDEYKSVGTSHHPGQFIGFDVFVKKNRALFVPGFHYHRISVENENEQLNFDFRHSHHLHYFTIPLTAGYTFIDHPIWTLSAMVGPEITFFYNLDQNNVGLDDDMLYGVSTGLTGMVHTEWFSFLTMEVKYHYGLQPIIKIRSQSKLRGLTFAAGIKF